jgi:tetratricopeptide (TPR) repeat protein
VAEALMLCERAWATCPAEGVAYASVAVLRAAKATAEQRRRVETWLAAAMRRRPESVVLPVFWANLQEMQGRYDGAMAAYRELLRRAPRQVLALNNLGYLLALKGVRRAEALELIQAAIDEAGPHPEFLDTRAVIYLKMGRADRAVADLRQAVAEGPTAAKYLHLAQAHLLAGDRPAARAAYREAQERHLKEADLHPLERGSLRQVERDLQRR